MTTRAASSLVAIPCLALLAACPTGGGLDAGPGPAPHGGDAGVDAGPHYPPYEVEEGWYPDEGLHDDPSRCGAAPYRWWGVSELGDVLVKEKKHEMSLQLLEGIKNQLSQQVVMDRDPQSAAEVWRVLYVTQDQGSLTEATGLVAWPDVDTLTELPVLLYLHGTTGFHDDCAPSSQIDSVLSANYYNAALVGLLASWGYLVVAPDYLGLKSMGEASEGLHPYFVAEPTAISSLDAVRAARKLAAEENASLLPGPIVSLGVSQGGHASAFVVRYQPHYAPELEIKGAVYNVPPLDLLGESLAALANPMPTTQGNAAVVLTAAESWYRSAEEGLAEVMTTAAEEAIVEHMENECSLPDLVGEAEDVFTPALLGGELEPWRCYGEENSLLHTSVPDASDVPALVVLAENDGLVNTAVERESVRTLCEAGEPLAFLECQGASHAEGFFYSLDDMFDFLDARLADQPLPEGACEITAPQKCSSDPR